MKKVFPYDIENDAWTLLADRASNTVSDPFTLSRGARVYFVSGINQAAGKKENGIEYFDAAEERWGDEGATLKHNGGRRLLSMLTLEVLAV